MIISSAAAIATAAPPPSHPPSCAISLKPCSSAPQPAALRFLNRRKLKRIGNQGGRRGKNLCRAELVHDAPFAAAIVSCVLTSLVAPIHSTDSEDEDEGGAIDSTDARFAVMGIIGFIPYFNWLSWVFAWLDTSRPRYLVYSIVYLAPYLRTNLSLSLDESWLPITSILVCIIHIQLEASIRNGDLEGFAFFNKASKSISPFIEKDDSVNSHDKSSEGRSKKHAGLPPSAEEPRNRFPTKQIDGLQQNEGIEETREKKSE
ncbi:hypothetical protein IEQ34_006130 [Dendrobium chrysotoxum]|uniref:Uncharacterized protein n=1 Tax=Dendrobium chrysotoxum TaxID=161865 RepID=A0AAV7HC12_DENCH|nr:hypothetical protein IEQ34_006130 [Dendrobium chrysotoxum]